MEASLSAYEPSAATVGQFWDPASGLWCVDIRPARPDAAKVFITNADDELWLDIGQSSFQLRLDRTGIPGQLSGLLEAVFAGCISEVGRPLRTEIRIELANGKILRRGHRSPRVPWTKSRHRQFVPYGPPGQIRTTLHKCA